VSALGVCIINSLMLQGKFGKGDSTFWEKSACVEVCGLLRGDLYFICTLCVIIKCYFVLNEHPSWSWESASKVLLFFALALNDSNNSPPTFLSAIFCNHCSNFSGKVHLFFGNPLIMSSTYLWSVAT
jgi:hypothetical protein